MDKLYFDDNIREIYYRMVSQLKQGDEREVIKTPNGNYLTHKGVEFIKEFLSKDISIETILEKYFPEVHVDIIKLQNTSTKKYSDSYFATFDRDPTELVREIYKRKQLKEGNYNEYPISCWIRAIANSNCKIENKSINKTKVYKSLEKKIKSEHINRELKNYLNILGDKLKPFFESPLVSDSQYFIEFEPEEFMELFKSKRDYVEAEQAYQDFATKDSILAEKGTIRIPVWIGSTEAKDYASEVDGADFVTFRQLDSGIILPQFMARESGLDHKEYIPPIDGNYMKLFLVDSNIVQKWGW